MSNKTETKYILRMLNEVNNRDEKIEKIEIERTPVNNFLICISIISALLGFFGYILPFFLELFITAFDKILALFI